MGTVLVCAHVSLGKSGPVKDIEVPGHGLVRLCPLCGRLSLISGALKLLLPDAAPGALDRRLSAVQAPPAAHSLEPEA